MRDDNDRYDQQWVRMMGLWRFKNYAMTIKQTTFYSCPKAEVDARPAWRKHEKEHKSQWARLGFWRFGAWYLYWTLTRGYVDNPLEREAREAAK